ncbi:MAG: LPS biosynthesis protein RfbU [Patescibacteria group bacterium]|nr:MAG: LPS biosynthesis protein RfbU [Patescibacteria group bacterium]
MRILQVCSYLYPALTYGGPAQMVYDLSKQLSSRNSVTIYTTDVWDQVRRILKSEKINSTHNFHVKYFRNTFNALAFKIRFFTGFGMVFDFIKNNKTYDVVHIHDVFIIPQLLIALLSIILKKPLFWTPHGVLDPLRLKKKTAIKKALLPVSIYFLKKATQVIAVSQKEAYDLKQLGLNNIVTIYNGVSKLSVEPTQKFSALKNKDKITLLYIGKIHQQKGLKESLLALKKSRINAQFIIAGPDDGGKTELETIIANLDIKDVYFLGFVGEKEKKELYKISDLFIHPSYAEGFSISILESMREGVPVVISDGCNFPEVENKNAGFIVRVSKLEKELSHLFKLVVKNKGLLNKMKEDAKRLVNTSYTTKVMAKKYEKLYEKHF